MKNTMWFIMALPVIFGSCTMIGSLNALSEDKNQFVFKKEFIGNWKDPKDAQESFHVDTIAGSSGKLYVIEELTRQEKDSSRVDTLYFLGRLVNIGEWQYLDCQVDSDKMLAGNKGMPDLLVSKHFIFNVAFNGSEKLELTAPDTEELLKLINAGKVKLHYISLKKDDYLILSSSSELQKAAEALNKFPQVYKDKTEFTRSG
jgi:hypothetical protein